MASRVKRLVPVTLPGPVAGGRAGSAVPQAPRLPSAVPGLPAADVQHNQRLLRKARSASGAGICRVSLQGVSSARSLVSKRWVGVLVNMRGLGALVAQAQRWSRCPRLWLARA